MQSTLSSPSPTPSILNSSPPHYSLSRLPCIPSSLPPPPLYSPSPTPTLFPTLHLPPLPSSPLLFPSPHFFPVATLPLLPTPSPIARGRCTGGPMRENGNHRDRDMREQVWRRSACVKGAMGNFVHFAVESNMGLRASPVVL